MGKVITLPEPLLRQASETARQKSIEVDTLVIRAVEWYLEEQRTLLEGFKCKQRGHCCLDLTDAFETCAVEEDIRLWEEMERYDILEWVDPISVGGEVIVYDIWIDPRTGDDVSRCPWLGKLPDGKYICEIHDVKPRHCRIYPRSKEHAEETGCPGFDD